MESELWEQFSKNYDEKVFSLTKIPRRRKQILEKINLGKILNIGCGSTSYLNEDLVKQGNFVVAADFCQAMLNSASEKFCSVNLEYVLSDTRKLIFNDNEFDSVISVNSILPPERKHVYEMGKEIYRVLKPEGIFISFLPSYDSTEKAKRNLEIEIETDDKQKKERDTTGWQCFHTPELIEDLMEKSGFSDYNFKKVFLKTKQEISELKRLYGVDTSKSLIYEYFLVARK